MKKLLTVLAASVGIAAFADTTPPLSATSFENYTQSDTFSVTNTDTGVYANIDVRVWAGDADADGDTNVITEYGEATKPSNRPDYYDNQAQSKFLKVDSTAGLARYVNAGGGAQGLDKNVYFDMDVQFTVSDSVQEAAEGDKLLVWLYAPEAEGDAAVATNLVVTAATIASNLETTPVNYVVAVPETSVQADTWYRLTVVSTTKDVSSAAVPHFQVYIDGKQAIPTGTMASNGAITALQGHDGLFGSLVKYAATDTTTKTLTSVTFKGTGAVDDLVVTTVKPSFIQPVGDPCQIGETGYASFDAALAAAKDGDTIKLLAACTSAEDSIDTAITVDLNGNGLTFSASQVDVNKAVTVVNSGAAATVSGTSFYVEKGMVTIGASTDIGAITFAATIEAYVAVKVYGSNAQPSLSDEGDYTAWSTKADADGYYEAVEGGEEPVDPRAIDGGTGAKELTVSAETITDAADALGVTASTITDAQILAYIVGGTVVNNEAVLPTPTISISGTTVSVVCTAEDSNYLIQYYLDSKADLTAEWTPGTTPVAATLVNEVYTATLSDSAVNAPQKFYRVRAVVSNKVTQN